MCLKVNAIDLDRKNEEELTSNYMCWLEDYIQRCGGFLDDDWKNSDKPMCEEDVENIQNFRLLFFMVERYAFQHVIHPVVQSYKIVFPLVYHNVRYEVGVLNGDDLIYFCNPILDHDYCMYQYYIDGKDVFYYPKRMLKK